MGCRRIQKRLKSFLDGEIDSARKAKVERHLAGCGRCRQALEEMDAVGRLLETYEGIEPPEHGLATLVLAARARKEKTRSIYSLVRTPLLAFRAHLFTPYGWATASVFLVGILVGQLVATFLLRQAPGQDEQSQSSAQAFDLEIFSELPPNSLEQRYWEALAAGQGGNG